MRVGLGLSPPLCGVSIRPPASSTAGPLRMLACIWGRKGCIPSVPTPRKNSHDLVPSTETVSRIFPACEGLGSLCTYIQKVEVKFNSFFSWQIIESHWLQHHHHRLYRSRRLLLSEVHGKDLPACFPHIYCIVQH